MPPNAKSAFEQFAGGDMNATNYASKFSSGTDPINPLRETTTREANRAAKTAIAPTYDEMFQKYLDVTRPEVDRNAAAIRESFGARGARYGSDILKAESDLRRQQSADQQLFAANTLNQMEGQRQNLLSLVGQGQSGVASYEMSVRESALNRAAADWARVGGIPPLIGPAGSYAASAGPSQTAIY